MHVAAYIEALLDPEGQALSTPTVKQHPAALRMLFDWRVVGHIIDLNPAHAVRGPKHLRWKGKTPVLSADKARALLDAIDTGSVVGLRDRALIGLMAFTIARVGAAAAMQVEDYIQGRRGRVRLHEKGGKRHDVPANHKLNEYLEAYIEGAGLAKDPKGPLFRTAEWKPAAPLTRRPTSQSA